MIKDSKHIAWAITLAAVGGIVLLSRRKSNPPSLIHNNMEYDYSKYGAALPLGYRSNNPLNIRYNAGNTWKGKVTPPATGQYGTYERFEDIVYGYRAALVLLRGKGYILGGLNTIRKIISKWAPEDDYNYTGNYINNVSKLTGIDPDTVISRNDRDALSKIVYAMSIIENGYKHKFRDDNDNVVTVDLKETYDLPNYEIIEEAWKIV